MRKLALALTALVFLFASVCANSSQEIKPMNVKRITPVLLVKEIEPVIPFWVDRLGFAKTTRPKKFPIPRAKAPPICTWRSIISTPSSPP
jgi:hypothetical protein